MKTSNLKIQKMGLLKRFFTGYADSVDQAKIFLILAGIITVAYLVAHFAFGFNLYSVKYDIR